MSGRGFVFLHRFVGFVGPQSPARWAATLIRCVDVSRRRLVHDCRKLPVGRIVAVGILPDFSGTESTLSLPETSDDRSEHPVPDSSSNPQLSVIPETSGSEPADSVPAASSLGALRALTPFPSKSEGDTSGRLNAFLDRLFK